MLCSIFEHSPNYVYIKSLKNTIFLNAYKFKNSNTKKL